MQNEICSRPRVVLLGASNLTRGFRSVVTEAHRRVAADLRVFAALGHGRSYGLKSSVLGRTLPGISGCGIWAALEASSPGPTTALVTDVGNDILYGASLDEIAAWVELCLARLGRLGSRTVVTLLPEASLERLGPARFTLIRTILFPRSRLRLGEALTLAAALNARLRSLAADVGASALEPDGSWYGLDPIHIRLRFTSVAWRRMLEPWGESGAVLSKASVGLDRVPSPLALRPAVLWRFGRERCCAQPCATLRSGTKISLY